MSLTTETPIEAKAPTYVLEFFQDAANRRKGSVFWKYAQPLLRVAPRGSDSTRVFAPAVALTNTSDFSNVKSSNLQSAHSPLLAKHFGTSATLRKIKATDESTRWATPFGKFIR
jgi:hypothetical protein